MKKGVFTIMNYFDAQARRAVDALLGHGRPRQRAVRRCCSDCPAPARRRSRPIRKRLLIGDDEHCWTDDGIFNIEGGCYAKAIDLTPEAEPEIFQALRFGAVLENVVYDPDDAPRRFPRHAASRRTRAARIRSSSSATPRFPASPAIPTDVIFLTCDAFGVLPPVSRLTPAQAMYHFISGYTAKVAGTEMGVTEPQATFSPCFGGPFLVWHPASTPSCSPRSAAAPSQRVAGQHRLERRRVRRRRADEARAHAGHHRRHPLRRARRRPHPARSRLRLRRRDQSPECARRRALPRNTWADKAAYDATARKLAKLFIDNFKKYESGVSAEVRAAGPKG